MRVKNIQQMSARRMQAATRRTKMHSALVEQLWRMRSI